MYLYTYIYTYIYIVNKRTKELQWSQSTIWGTICGSLMACRVIININNVKCVKCDIFTGISILNIYCIFFFKFNYF